MHRHVTANCHDGSCDCEKVTHVSLYIAPFDGRLAIEVDREGALALHGALVSESTNLLTAADGEIGKLLAQLERYITRGDVERDVVVGSDPRD